MGATKGHDSGYLIEFYPIGQSVKVSAVDPDSGTEVSIVGPSTATQQQLTDLAVRKLEFVLKRGEADRRDKRGPGIFV